MKPTHLRLHFRRNLAIRKLAWPSLRHVLLGLTLCCGAVLAKQSLLAQTAPPAASPCLSPPAGLQNWWPGDGNAREIQSSRNGSILGNVSSAPGKVGQAFNFDGTNAVVDATVDFIGTDNWSMSAWVFWRGPSKAAGQKGEAIVYHGDGGSNGYGLFIVAPGWCKDYPEFCPHVGELIILFGGVRWYFTDTVLPAGTWTHIALVRASGLLKLYLNGALAWNRLSVDPIQPALTFEISSRQPYAFNGLIDEVALFNTPLDGGDFTLMVGAGASGMCKAPELTKFVRVGNARVQFEAKGQRNKDVMVFVSPDLTNWEAIIQLPNVTGNLNFSAPVNRGIPQRFYRLAPAN
jgi:hypothetical protein